MSLPRAISLLACLALLSPLAAFATPACGPAQHCPMAGMAGDAPPCHGAAIQADDCCVLTAVAAPAEVVPVTAGSVLPTDDGAPAPRPELAKGAPAACGTASLPPLYRLFRALLI
jgi:hypothetical protein